MFTPISDRLIVKKPVVNEVHSSGLYIPDGSDDQVQCLVVAVGAGAYENGHLIAPTVKVGDTIILQKGYGQPIKFEGEDYIIVTEPEVIGII